MAPVASGAPVSAARARLAGPSGFKGIVASGKTTGIAFFASLGGFVYGSGLDHEFLHQSSEFIGLK
jgi:hypothetical protein